MKKGNAGINRSFREASFPRWEKQTRTVLERKEEEIDVSKHVTVLDLRFLPSNATKAEVRQWIAKYTHTELSVIEGKGGVKEKEEFFRSFQRSYDRAVQYLMHEWFMEGYIPKELLQYSFQSIEDIERFVAHTKHLSKTVHPTHRDEERQTMYCVLTKVTLASLEIEKANVQKLIEHAELLEKMFQTSTRHDEALFDYIYSDKEGSKPVQMRRVNDLPSELKIAHPVQFDFRSKSEASAMSKFLRVEGNADSYLKDGLAMRFTADYKDISALALNVMLWLSRNAKATHLLLENGGILHESDDVELMRYIHLLPQLRVEVGENTPNVSSGGFKAMKILGRLGAPFKNTRFEVQIVLKDNRNERGGFSHHTYEVARHIANITRTMDACPEDVFQKLVEQASVRSGKKVDTIIAELTGGKKSRVLYATAKSRRAIRVLSPKIYDDWYIKGWIPEDAYREVRRLPKKDSKAPST